MRGQSTCAVCCGGLCQHPECWRSNIQQVREAVWRRNGVNSHERTHDKLHLQKEQRDDSRHGDLPTLKIVDIFSDLDAGVQKTSRKYLNPIHQRSSSLPCLPSAVVSQESIFSLPRSPRQSPALTSPPLTEYQRRMKWKKQLDGLSRVKNASDSIKMSTIGVHEVYEDNELDQEWQEVYVTSAYLVWCPSNKKGRKAKRNSSNSEKRHNNKKVIPKDVTEDLVPASVETIKQCRPKSTKTPTGGQPFSPHKSVTNPALCQYGMEDLSNLPKPVLSGILKRINWRSNEGTPSEEQEKTKNTDAELVASQQEGSKMLLAVDINSRFTTPEEDGEEKEQKDIDKENSNIIKETTKTEPFRTEDLNDMKQRREFLSMHSIGLPIDDLPEPKHHHCTNSIPRRMSLGVALEPVNLVPITPSPAPTPKQSSQKDLSIEAQKPDEPSLVVNVPSGRPESAPMHNSLDIWEKFQDQYYVNSAFRYTPSPVRAPAPTPISPDKYSEFARYSRTSRRTSSSQDEQILKSMRRWNTLSSVYDSDDTRERCAPIEKDAFCDKKNGLLEGGSVFLTEGVTDEIDKMAVPTPKCRSPSPGSMTCIPKDIIEQFQGDIYGRRYPRTETKEKLTRKTLTHISTGIVAPGWRPPRSRTPIQLSETPARYPPRPLRQPPVESIPKSLKIISIPKQTERFRRPRSTPPRTNTPNDNDLVPLVLSESSLVNQSVESAISMEVQGTSSHSTDHGAIPPPPSPEALKNELQPTLETLCEEDERSSRNTSIIDVIDKEMPLSRLSPLGGGSEISDESVDLPIELDVRQSNNDSITESEFPQKEQENLLISEKAYTYKTDQHQPEFDLKLARLEGGSSERFPEEVSSKLQPKEVPSKPHPDQVSSKPYADEVSSEAHQGDVSSEPHQEEVLSNPHQEEVLSNPNPEGVLSNPHQEEVLSKPNQEEVLSNPNQEEVLSNPHQEEVLSNPNQEEVLSNPHQEEVPSKPFVTEDYFVPRPKQVSPELHPKQESRETNDNSSSLEMMEEKTDLLQDLHQPPGSPDAASTPDFTEGIDMELDLAAELQAAMEGLDDFNIDDINEDER